MNWNKLFLNASLQRAAEFSGASRRIALPEPALITNPYPDSTQLHGYNQGFVINAG
jgi:hypothetical protein